MKYLNIVDGKTNSPRVFGHNSSQRPWRGTGIGGNGSYKPPGAPETLQDPGEKPKTCYIKPAIFIEKIKEQILIILLNILFGPTGRNFVYCLPYGRNHWTCLAGSNALYKEASLRAT